MVNFLAIRHWETAEELSAALGEKTVFSKSISRNVSRGSGFGSAPSTSRSTSQNQTGQRLMTATEIMQMATDQNGGAEEQIILIRGQKPIRTGVAKFFRRPEMQSQIV